MFNCFKININYLGLFDMYLFIKENVKIIIRYIFCDDIVFYGIYWNILYCCCMKRWCVCCYCVIDKKLWVEIYNEWKKFKFMFEFVRGEKVLENIIKKYMKKL